MREKTFETILNLIGYIVVITLCIYWTKSLLNDDFPWIFLSTPDLIFHEAGHWVFRLFGETLGIWGGTLMQCLIPITVLGAFIYKKDCFGISYSVFWLGENLVNISKYISDAQIQALPLLGGDNVIHDWNWLLTRYHLLQSDITIGNNVFIAAKFLIILSIAAMICISLNKFLLLFSKPSNFFENYRF